MNSSHQTSQQSGGSEMNLQFLTPDQDETEDQWVSDQFNKLPYIIYKIWLALNIILVLALQPELLSFQFTNYASGERMSLAVLSGGCFFAAFCCAEMLYAMIKRKSESAHKSFVKFQYSIIAILYGLLTGGTLGEEFSKSQVFQLFLVLILPICVIISFFACYSVFGVFKRDNSLTRFSNYRNSDQHTKDMIFQNALLADQLLNYDRQLNGCVYIFYKIWLKFVVIMVLAVWILPILWSKFRYDLSDRRIRLVGDIYFLIVGLWTVFYCYDVEVALRTKKPEKSKKVVSGLKISVLMWIISPVVDLIFSDNTSLTWKYLGETLVILLFPLVAYFGAVKINKIIEQRDQFAKASTDSGDHHL